MGDFYNGLLHPLLEIEHLVAILVLALCLRQQSLQDIRRGLVSFVGGLLLALPLSVSSWDVGAHLVLVSIAVCCGLLMWNKPCSS